MQKPPANAIRRQHPGSGGHDARADAAEIHASAGGRCVRGQSIVDCQLSSIRNLRACKRIAAIPIRRMPITVS